MKQLLTQIWEMPKEDFIEVAGYVAGTFTKIFITSFLIGISLSILLIIWAIALK